VDPNECNQKGSIGYTVQMIFSTITPIYTINEASFQRLHLNSVLPQELESDPSGVKYRTINQSYKINSEYISEKELQNRQNRHYFLR
jgi:hypothetical protein